MVLPQRLRVARAAKVQQLESLTGAIAAKALAQLLFALADNDPLVRLTAIESLQTFTGKVPARPLIKLLADRDAEVRFRTIEALGRLLEDKRRSPHQIIDALRDPDSLVRIAAAEALGSIGDRKALPALWNALSDGSPLVRSYAASGIGCLGTRKDIPRLKAVLSRTRSETVRVGLSEALYQLGEADALEILLGMLSSENYRIRCAVANTLAGIHLERTQVPGVIRCVRQALAQEPTVAAKSSMQFALKAIR